MAKNDPSAAEPMRPDRVNKGRVGGAKLPPPVPTDPAPGAAMWTFMLWAGLLTMFILLLVRIARY